MIELLLSETSEWTWQFLRDAPFRPREETITESLLTDIHRRGAGYTQVYKASVGEEVTYGLDWAWTIETSAGWLNLIVQAKQISGRRFGVYAELRKATAVGQAQSLIQAAAMFGAVPVYAFYNNELPPFGSVGSSVTLGACLRLALIRESASQGYPWDGYSSLGVTLAHAEDVEEFVLLPPASNQWATNVNNFAMPWECLLCPSWLDRQTSTWLATPPESPRIAAVAAALARRVDRLVEGEGEPAWLTRQMPPWAQAMSEGLSPLAVEDGPRATYFVISSRGEN